LLSFIAVTVPHSLTIQKPSRSRGALFAEWKTALEFKLFVRSTCDLCEAMEAELVPLVAEYGLTIARIYIDNDQALQDRYGSSVPVLEYQGAPVCQYFLDRQRLLAIINNENTV
jgi:thiol-disulfide isomerase/thioredoxin